MSINVEIENERLALLNTLKQHHVDNLAFLFKIRKQLGFVHENMDPLDTYINHECNFSGYLNGLIESQDYKTSTYLYKYHEYFEEVYHKDIKSAPKPQQLIKSKPKPAPKVKIVKASLMEIMQEQEHGKKPIKPINSIKPITSVKQAKPVLRENNIAVEIENKAIESLIAEHNKSEEFKVIERKKKPTKTLKQKTIPKTTASKRKTPYNVVIKPNMYAEYLVYEDGTQSEMKVYFEDRKNELYFINKNMYIGDDNILYRFKEDKLEPATDKYGYVYWWQ